MQYAVPQFTDVEDKIIGNFLSLKQFFILLAFAGVVFLFWSIFDIGILFFMTAIPVGLVGAYVTFKKFNGRSFYSYFAPLATYITSPKVMVFHREPVIIHIPKKVPAKKLTTPNPADQEPPSSRLRKLAYMLDQKSSEENELIIHTNLK